MPERDPSANQLIVSYLTLRKAIGWIGVLLPFVLLLGNLTFFSGAIPGSVSEYYYTHMRNVFVGALWAVGVFLLAYSGYDEWDRWITNIAGAGAIATSLCPTAPQFGVLTFGQEFVGYVHIGFATVTFTAFAVMSFRFTKSSGAAVTPRKRARNRIYRTCGIAIIVSLLLAGGSLVLPESLRSAVPFVYIFEAIAIVAFGVSWFVKGQTLLPFLKDLEPIDLGQAATADA